MPSRVLSSLLCASLISRLLPLLQNLLPASRMIKRSVYYTILNKTNLTLGSVGAKGEADGYLSPRSCWLLPGGQLPVPFRGPWVQGKGDMQSKHLAYW